MPVQSPQEQSAEVFPGGLPSRRINREFTAALLARVRTEARVVRGDAGQLVHSGHTPLAALPLVESGLLEVVLLIDDEGRRVVPVWFGPGEIAMLSSLFAAESGVQPVRADLVWRQAGRLRWIDRDVIEAATQAQPLLMGLLARFLAQRLREVQHRERGWLERSVHERVRSVLARAASDNDGVLALTHEALAERCGVSRPKLSAALKLLERAGVLTLHRGRVQVIRADAL
jgi:CRP/FNR family transcriptional regulator